MNSSLSSSSESINSIAYRGLPTTTHQECELDSEMDAIFGAGIVVTETRTGRILESNLSTEQADLITVSAPLSFRNTMAQRANEVAADFSSSHVKAEFLVSQVQKQGEFTKLVTNLTPDKTVNVLNYITSKFTKEQPLPVKVCGTNFLIPRIDSAHLSDISSGLDAYQTKLLATLTSSLAVQGKRLHPKETIDSLNRLLHERAASVSKRSPRLEVTLKILVTLVLELAANRSQQSALEALATSNISDDIVTGGAFIPLIQTHTSIDTRAESMIQDCSISTALNVTYNMDFRQIKHLLTYILDGNSRNRLESKISLLSSLKEDQRSDVVLSPRRVLHRVISEHYLTRHEVLLLIFEDSKHSLRCPTCSRTVGLTNQALTHTNCEIVEWLVSEFQLTLTPTGLTIPLLAYMQPSLAQYSRELISLDAKIKRTPLISRTRDELSVYQLDSTGAARKTLHQGTKTVNLVPTTSKR